MISDHDVREIEQLLYRYCAGVDRRDWELLASCYHPGAVDDHGDVSGPASEFLAWVERRHERVLQSFHAVTNVRVFDEVTDAAVTETLCLVRQTLNVTTVARSGCGSAAGISTCSAGTTTEG